MTHISAITRTLVRLRDDGPLPGVAAHLRQHGDAICAELEATVLAEVPAFTLSHDAATVDELVVHGPQHLAEIVRLFDGGALENFSFVRDHARLRAEHSFPLESVLHAYRCNHKVLLRWLREAALAAVVPAESVPGVLAGMADFILEYTDAISTIASNAHVDSIRLLAEVAGDQRAQLLDILLGGHDESDARIAAVLRRAGYLDARQSFCVVLAQPVDAAEMDNPARARRLAETLDQLVPADLARRLIDVRGGRVTCVFSAVRRASGWTPANAPLAGRVAAELASAGNAVLIGVSNDVWSTSMVPSAHRQAMLAMRMTSLNHRVIQFDGIALRQLMIHLGGEELPRLLPAWAGHFNLADDRLKGVLTATLRAYADADMNVLKAAVRLAVHPNTIYARMNRIHEITGLNARSYHALTDLITVADARAVAPSGHSH